MYVDIRQLKAVLVGSLAMPLLQYAELIQLFVSIMTPIKAAIQKTAHQKQNLHAEPKQKHFCRMCSGDLRKEGRGR